MPSLVSLSAQQVKDISRLIGLSSSVEVREITQHNHVWQLSDEHDTYFLKIYTKSWYRDDIAGTAFCVKHEQDAYTCLAVHGLQTPEVILAKRDLDNPLGRPFIVTRKLKGASLMTYLETADPRQFQTLLEKTGDYMGRMHAIPFTFSGYIIDNGPLAPPDENSWQHPSWSAKKTQQMALSRLDADRAKLPSEMIEHFNTLFSNMSESLAEVFQPPHFVQVNCHSHQYYLWHAPESWEVSGCYLYDLVGFCIEMATFFPPTTHWWQPFFQGYGRDPDFSLFKLLMLGLPELSFKIYGETRWDRTRQEILSRLLAASNWHDLFTT